MDLLVRKDFTDGKFTVAFVGYGGEYEGALIVLTHNWETRGYDLDNGFGHIAIYTGDVYGAFKLVATSSSKVVSPPLVESSMIQQL